MIDFDKLMESGIDAKLFGKEITILEPTAEQFKKIDKLQSEMGPDNAIDKRFIITKLILNNNAEKVIFTDAQIKKIPVKLQVAIHTQLQGFQYKLNNDPN